MEDVTTNGAGAPVANGAAPGAQPVTASVVAGSPEPQQAISPEDFRKFQATMDRQVSQAAQRAALAEQELNAIKAKLNAQEQAQLEALDPAEQNARLKAKLQEIEDAGRRKTELDALFNTAYGMVSEAKIAWEDSRIQGVVSQVGAVPALLPALSRQITAILLANADAARLAAATTQQQTTQQVQSAAQAAQVAALNAAGVTTVSTATGAAPPIDERARLVAQFKTKYAAVKGKGLDSPAWMGFADALRAAGLQLSDLR